MTPTALSGGEPGDGEDRHDEGRAQHGEKRPETGRARVGAFAREASELALGRGVASFPPRGAPVQELTRLRKKRIADGATAPARRTAILPARPNVFSHLGPRLPAPSIPGGFPAASPADRGPCGSIILIMRIEDVRPTPPRERAGQLRRPSTSALRRKAGIAGLTPGCVAAPQVSGPGRRRARADVRRRRTGNRALPCLRLPPGPANWPARL